MSAIIVMSDDHLKTLKLGQVFRSEGLFQGLSNAPLEWTVVDLDARKFSLTYMGIHMGTYVLHKQIKKKAVLIPEES